MFNLAEFIITNTVNGVKNGTFTKEYANIMAVNYMLKGVLTQDDVVSINEQIEIWEAVQNAEIELVEPEEIPVEDVLDELVEELTELDESIEEVIEEVETVEE